MAAQLLQAVVFFRFGSAGWSETFYQFAEKHDCALALQRLMKERRKFLSSSCKLLGGRIRVVGRPRDCKIVPPPGFAIDGLNEFSELPGQAGPIAVNFESSPNRIQDCVCIRSSTAAGNIRYTWCHGISDGYIEDGTWNPLTKGSFDAKIKPYLEQLTNGLWRIKTNNAPEGQSIIGMLNDPDWGNMVKVAVPDVSVFAAKNLVQLTGTGIPAMNGFWRVFATVSAVPPQVNSYVILRGSQRYNINSLATGTIRRVTASSEPITEVIINGLTNRKVGRPFGALRGKASAKLLHR